MTQKIVVIDQYDGSVDVYETSRETDFLLKRTLEKAREEGVGALTEAIEAALRKGELKTVGYFPRAAIFDVTGQGIES